MKKVTFILFIILFSFQARAQFTVNYSFGYGTYKMNDMQDILKTALDQMNGTYPGLDARIVDNFPGYITHSLDLGYLLKQHEFGLRGSFLTTGGKISRADYSGEYEETLTLTGIQLKLYYRNYFYTSRINNNSSLSLFGELSPGIIFSKMKTGGHLTLDNQTQQMDQVKVNGTNFSVSPQVGIKYNLTPHIGFLISSGYDFNFGSDVDKLGGNKIDWSGFRVNGGVSYTF